MSPTEKEKIEYIMNEFDFAKVRRVMEFLDWGWYGEGVPNVDVMRSTARRLLGNLTGSIKSLSSATGGFRAYRSTGETGEEHFTLTFDLESAESTYY